jgi:lipopolysaccharide export system ATP-binding protein
MISMTNETAQNGKSVLRSDLLIKRYKKRTVVNQVTVQVRQGEIVGLLGPNGAGKTTTFYMIVGMVRPNGGRVFVDDQELTTMPMYQRARLGIGYLPQEASVFRRLTVRENLLAVLEISDLPRPAREEKCDRLLEDFGLTHLVKSKGYVLSGGERRRTEIARALALDPKFMLLDEPFAGIDPIAVEDIMKIVTKLKEKNIGVLVTDHNVHETLSITDQSYLLFEGKILKSGTAEYLANDPEARRLYLGENFKLDRYQ